MRIRNSFRFAVFFGLIFCIWACSRCDSPRGSGSSEPQVGYHVGNIAPDFALPARDGSVVHLSDFRGKLVFLNFWATWCGPCQEEMPSMERLYQKLKAENFAMIAVSVDEDGWRAIDPFVQSLGLNFAVLWDEKDEARKTFHSFRFPETFIVGKDGKIVDKFVGGHAWDTDRMADYFRRLSGP